MINDSNNQDNSFIEINDHFENASLHSKSPLY